MIPTHRTLVTHDVAGPTFNTVFILEFHLLKALVAEIVALRWATPNTHHVGTVVALAGLNNDMCMLVFVNVVSNQTESILNIVSKQSEVSLFQS